MSTITTRSGKGSPLTNNEVDSNFTNLNTDKAELSGATFTGEITANGGIALGDNDKATFGAGDDLEIYHDGTQSRIVDTGTGNLKIQAQNFAVNNVADTENMITAEPDGFVKLFHNGAEKIATTATGIAVTGNASFADGGKATFGAGDDLEIYHSGTHSYIKDSGTGNLNILASASINLLNGDSSDYMARFNDNGSNQFFYDGSEKLATTSTGIDITGNASFDDNGKATFGSGDDLQIYHDGGNSRIVDSGTGILAIQASSQLGIYNADGTQASAEFVNDGKVGLRFSGSEKLATTATGIDVTGNVSLPDNGKATFGASDDLSIWHGGTDSYVKNDAGTLIVRTDSLRVLNAANSEQVFHADANGAVTAYYDNAAKLATTSTGIDVTGIVTADKLAVTYGVAGSAAATITHSDVAEGYGLKIQAGGTGTSRYVLKANDGGNNSRFEVLATGDVSFYEDTGSTPKMVWDSSAEKLTLSGAGGLYVGAGSAGDPSIKMNDVNSGLFAPSGNVVAISAGGGERFRATISGIDVTGNATFSGTATMDGLTVDGSGTIASFKRDAGVNGQLDLSFPAQVATLNASSSFAFQTAATERMRLTSTGLGIGTSSPDAKFHSYQPAANYAAHFESANANSYGVWVEEGASANNGYPLLSVTDNGGSTQYFRVDSGTGRVGIGTSSPDAIIETSASAAGNTVGALLTNTNGSGTADSVSLNFGLGRSVDGYVRSVEAIKLLKEQQWTGTASTVDAALVFSTVSDETTAERMHISADGSVGIGTVPKTWNTSFLPLQIGNSAYLYGRSSQTAMEIGNNAYFGGSGWTYTTTNTAQRYIQDSTDNAHKWFNAASGTAEGSLSWSERMRINASGDWMVSNTVANVASGYSTQEGCGWVDSDTHFEIATTSNRSALEIGKNNANDGGLVTFRKQGSTVGSIGTAAGNLYIVSNDVGLNFAGGGDGIYPATANGAQRDAAIDLGASSHRFKDLYLAGGVYLGGTGAANKLDDYEEGTWTPTLTTDGTDFTSVTYDAGVSGTYTKVGRVVTVDGFMRTDAITKGSASGFVQIGGLPFAATGAISVGNVGGTTGWLVNSPTNCQNSGAKLYLTYGANSTAFINLGDVATAANDNEVRFQVTYQAS